MLESELAAIGEGIKMTMVIGTIFWVGKTAFMLALLKRKAVVARKNTDLCQKLHEALGRLADNPKSRILKAYIDCLYADLQSRRSINYRQNTIKQEIEKQLRPSIRESMIQYERNKSHENYRRLKAGLCPILYRHPSAAIDGSLSLKYRYEFAKECTQELAWLYVFHSNQLKNFVEDSRFLRLLPWRVKKKIYWLP